MDRRAAHLIASLGMAPHPEGGHYREVYRSASRVERCDDRAQRSAMTTIYFLLTAGEVSAWHRVASDEAWHYYEGDALELVTADRALERVTRTVLGPAGNGMQPVHVVAADVWQAARTLGAYTLVGCTVGPGFEYEDFQMLRDRPESQVIAKREDLAAFI